MLNNNTENNYWKGPFGIKVPNNVEVIVAEDGRNSLYKTGETTKMCFDPLSKEEYLNKYTILGSDGFYYWKEKHIRDNEIEEVINDNEIEKVINDNYWKGPFGILVPNYIKAIAAEDGKNTLSKNGHSTKMCFDPLSKEEYLNKYATLGDDGYYYWKETMNF